MIKNSKIFENIFVLTGKCPTCNTTYHGDHERTPVVGEENKWSRVYLNSAKYLKVGSSTWVDRHFSNTVVSGIYSFHASAAAYTEFWNNSFWKLQDVNCFPLSQRHIW